MFDFRGQIPLIYRDQPARHQALRQDLQRAGDRLRRAMDEYVLVLQDDDRARELAAAIYEVHKALKELSALKAAYKAVIEADGDPYWDNKVADLLLAPVPHEPAALRGLFGGPNPSVNDRGWLLLRLYSEELVKAVLNATRLPESPQDECAERPEDSAAVPAAGRPAEVMPSAARDTAGDPGPANLPEPRPYPVLVAGVSPEVLAQLGLAAPAPDEFAPRPPAPIAAWCLLPDGRVRWEGDPVRLPPLLYRLLAHLLNAGPGPLPAADVAEGVWGDDAIRAKRLANSLSELNNRLNQIQFPWSWHIGREEITRQG
jgi:hypothetical protein